MSTVRSRVRHAALALVLCLLFSGAFAARALEPGVSVQPVDVPRPAAPPLSALRFRPSAPASSRPTALLAHGVTASKETLFLLAEALATAGFDVLALDLPGHGASPGPFGPAADLEGAMEAGARALEGGVASARPASVTVLLGHSLGAYVGAAVLADRRVSADLFVALGALPRLSPRTGRALFLLGAHDELLSTAEGRFAAAESGAPLLLSPFSDHVLEPYDPQLVTGALQAAVEVAHLAPPPPRSAWRRRLAGALAAAVAALLLVAFASPAGPLGRARGAAAGLGGAAVAIAALLLAGWPWIGAQLVASRFPQQLAFALGAAAASLAGAALAGTSRRLRPHRGTWGQLALAALLATAAALCGGVGAPFQALVFALATAVLLVATAVGGLVARRTREAASAHAAFAAIVGFAFGQWMPLVY